MFFVIRQVSAPIRAVWHLWRTADHSGLCKREKRNIKARQITQEKSSHLPVGEANPEKITSQTNTCL